MEYMELIGEIDASIFALFMTGMFWVPHIQNVSSPHDFPYYAIIVTLYYSYVKK